MKKVLFIYPNVANWAIIGTAVPILAGLAKKHNWSMEYFDTFRYEKERDSTIDKETAGGFKPGFSKQKTKQLPHDNIILDLQSKIKSFRPDLVAVTGLSHDYEFFMSFFPKIKLPEKTIVAIGGICTNMAPDDIAKTKMFDLINLGEGEETFAEILTNLEKNKTLKNISGTYFVDKKTGKIIKNPRRLVLKPEATWKTEQDFSFFNNNYFIRPFDGKMIRRYDVEVGRGCPFNCNYCGNSVLKKLFQGYGNYIKTRPLDSIFKHIKKMIKKYKIDVFQFTDECFMSRPNSWLEEFGKRYAEECKKPFIATARAEVITAEKIKILLKYNAPFQISVGVESGSEHILNEICNRQCKTKQIIKAFDLLHKFKVRTNAFFMLGLPYETRKDLFKTVELCRRIKPSVSSISIFQPLPGQALTQLCIEKGFITGKEPMNTFTSGSSLKMPAPYLSAREIVNFWRVFALYCSLPKKYFPQIELCENDFNSNKKLFESLVALRWKSYDYSQKRDEMRVV